jgi:hypothetical protein
MVITDFIAVNEFNVKCQVQYKCAQMNKFQICYYLLGEEFQKPFCEKKIRI